VTEERNYEAEASEQGWTPKENWKGPEEKWTDAQTFVERGEQIAGILKSKNAKLETRIHNLEDSNKKFGEYHKKTLETEQRKNAERIGELEGQLEQAITDGDGQAFTRYNKELDGLKAEQQVPTDDAQAWNQLSQRWVGENEWYTKNSKLAAYADGISDQLRANGYTGQAYFSELTRNVHETFPEEFKNPNKSKANAVDDGGQKGSNDSKAHTFENLPADAQRAFEGFNADFGLKKEDYLKNYEWEE